MLSPTRGKAAYFEAALEILAADGADGLTQAALCERLYVTTGAFYHHFGSMGEFLAAFAESRRLHYVGVHDGVEREPDPVRRIEALGEAFLAMSHTAEAAYRGWGKTNPVIKETLTGLDRRAEEIMARAITELYGDRARAELLADMALSLVIGIQQRDRSADPARVVDIIVEWYRSCLHLDARVVEVAGETSLRLRRPVTGMGTDGQ